MYGIIVLILIDYKEWQGYYKKEVQSYVYSSHLQNKRLLYGQNAGF